MERIERKPVRMVLATLVAIQLVVGFAAAMLVSPGAAMLVSPGRAQAIAPPAVAAAGPAALTKEPAPSTGPAPGETAAADVIGPSIQLFAQPGVPAPSKSLPNPTFEHVPLIFHVVEEAGPWLHVRVNIRPNGTMAWIRRSDVNVRRIPNRIVVELGARRLTVLHGNDVLAQHRVAIGAPSGPTPVGEFYVDATVHIKNAGGPYGVGQMSVSGFSNVYQTFGGGIGQIAIHGTNNPSAIGGSVSHGCIRMLNDGWTQVSSLAPNGTPVSIRP